MFMKVVNKDFNDVLVSAERYLSKKESYAAAVENRLKKHIIVKNRTYIFFII